MWTMSSGCSGSGLLRRVERVLKLLAWVLGLSLLSGSTGSGRSLDRPEGSGCAVHLYYATQYPSAASLGEVSAVTELQPGVPNEVMASIALGFDGGFMSVVSFVVQGKVSLPAEMTVSVENLGGEDPLCAGTVWCEDSRGARFDGFVVRLFLRAREESDLRRILCAPGGERRLSLDIVLRDRETNAVLWSYPVTVRVFVDVEWIVAKSYRLCAEGG